MIFNTQTRIDTYIMCIHIYLYIYLCNLWSKQKDKDENHFKIDQNPRILLKESLQILFNKHMDCTNIDCHNSNST